MNFTINFWYALCKFHITIICNFVIHTVPEVIVERPNVTIPEGPPEVEICILLTTGVTEEVVVTAETGPKSGAANQATGISLSYICASRVHRITFILQLSLTIASPPSC